MMRRSGTFSGKTGLEPSGQGFADQAASEGGGFVDQFEDGDYDGWSVLWLPENSGGPRSIRNDWSVVEQSALQGEYSLELNSLSDHNAIATDDYVIDLSGDFEFSFEFYFENGNSRGAKTSVIDIDRNGSEGGERVSTDHLSSFISAYRKPAEEEAGLTVLGNTETVEYSEISTGSQHSVRLLREEDTITGYLNGSEIQSFQASESETELDQSYRLVLISSGSWGEESRIWWDSIQHSGSGEVTETPTATPTKTPTPTPEEITSEVVTSPPDIPDVDLNPSYFRSINLGDNTYNVYWGLESEPEDRLAVVDQGENLVNLRTAKNVLISNAHLEHISLEPWDQFIENAQNRRDFYKMWEGSSRLSDLGIAALATFALSTLSPLAGLSTAVDALETSVNWAVNELDTPYKETLSKMQGICRSSLQHGQVVRDVVNVEELPKQAFDNIELAVATIDNLNKLSDVANIGAEMARVANSSDDVVAALKAGGASAGSALGSMVVGRLVSKGVNVGTKPFEAHAKTAAIGVALNTLLPPLYDELSTLQERIVDGIASPAEISLYWRHRISTHQLISVGHRAMSVYEGWLSDQPLGAVWNVLQNAETIERTGRQSSEEHYNLSMYYWHRQGRIWDIARSQTENSVNAEVLGGEL
jgi:hypothetical protein